MSENPDTVVEITQRSWGDRLIESLKGIVVGLLLIPLSMALLSWNEERAADRSATLATAAREVISVAAERIDPANDGRLVHVMGRATVTGSLHDPDFDLSVPAIRLIRRVELYQWQEHSSSETRDKLGGGSETVTTYRYETGWSETLTDSSAFRRPAGHENPAFFPYGPDTQTASRVMLGAFRLSESLTDGLTAEQPVPLKQALRGLPPELADETVTITGNELYLGADPSRPVVGDVRIRFTMVPPAEISVISRQAGGTFAAYDTPTGPVELIGPGLQGPGGLLKTAASENSLLTWGLRLTGFLMMFFGFRLLFGLVEAIAAVIPPLGWVTGSVLSVISGLLALVLSLTTIGTAWLVQHPLYAAGIGLAGAAALTVWYRTRRTTA